MTHSEFEKHLLSNGYQYFEYPKSGYGSELFQKRCENADGKTRYFINVTKLTLPQRSGDIYMYTPSLQANLHNGASINIECVQWYNIPTDATVDIADAEKFLEKAFVALELQDYD